MKMPVSKGVFAWVHLTIACMVKEFCAPIKVRSRPDDRAFARSRMIQCNVVGLWPAVARTHDRIRKARTTIDSMAPRSLVMLGADILFRWDDVARIPS